MLNLKKITSRPPEHGELVSKCHLGNFDSPYGYIYIFNPFQLQHLLKVVSFTKLNRTKLQCQLELAALGF